MVEETGNQAEKKQAPGKNENGGGNKFLLIGIIAGVLVVNALVAVVFIQVTKPKASPPAFDNVKADSLKTTAERGVQIGAVAADAIEAIVNIAETDGERFLKVRVLLEYDDKKNPGLGVELAKRTPRFKDMLIEQLSQLTLRDLNEPDARSRIRRNFLRVVNTALPPKSGEVRDVLLDQYIIQ